MTASSKAIFLSYASEDAEAARRICEALRAAGLTVWFDQNELRGGDAWDASIRKKIKECALFVPVISANTESRSEGYFRLEWKLAVDRSHLMADDQPSSPAARTPRPTRSLRFMPIGARTTTRSSGSSAPCASATRASRGPDPTCRSRGSTTTRAGRRSCEKSGSQMSS